MRAGGCQKCNKPCIPAAKMREYERLVEKEFVEGVGGEDVFEDCVENGCVQDIILTGEVSVRFFVFVFWGGGRVRSCSPLTSIGRTPLSLPHLPFQEPGWVYSMCAGEQRFGATMTGFGGSLVG